MYSVEISDPQIKVSTRQHHYAYSVDNSLPNPLEATYAAIAGCAGVYALKAAKKIGKDASGIKISGRPYAKPDNPLMLAKWVTTVTFPEGWEQKDCEYILDKIKKCAVKDLIRHGAEIDFATEISRSN